MDEQLLLKRMTVNPKMFGGKPIVRDRRLAVEPVLGMLAAGDSPDTILRGWSVRIFKSALPMPIGSSAMSESSY
jgi:uncharacterized protein (DUF433 family)